MAQERPDSPSREERVRRVLGPENERNQAAINTIKVIEEALGAGETGARIDFRVYFDASPFFDSYLVEDGLLGVDVEVGCLEEREGELFYQERELGLRWKLTRLRDPKGVFGFSNMFKAGRYVFVDFCFFSKPGNITKDPETGKIELQGVWITGWRQ
jgi:hypothetical protein